MDSNYRNYLLQNLCASIYISGKYTALFMLILLSLTKTNWSSIPYNMEDFCNLKNNTNSFISECNYDDRIIVFIFPIVMVMMFVVMYIVQTRGIDDLVLLRKKAKIRSHTSWICTIITIGAIGTGIYAIDGYGYDIKTGYKSINYKKCINFEITENNYKEFMQTCDMTICNIRHPIALIGGCSLIGYVLFLVCLLILTIIVSPFMWIFRHKLSKTYIV